MRAHSRKWAARGGLRSRSGERKGGGEVSASFPLSIFTSSHSCCRTPLFSSAKFLAAPYGSILAMCASAITGAITAAVVLVLLTGKRHTVSREHALLRGELCGHFLLHRISFVQTLHRCFTRTHPPLMCADTYRPGRGNSVPIHSPQFLDQSLLRLFLCHTLFSLFSLP